MQHALAGLCLEVGCGLANAFVQRLVGRGIVETHRVARATGWRAFRCRRFDFFATRTQFAATHQRGRAGQVECQADDVDAFEWLKAGDGLDSGRGHGFVYNRLRRTPMIRKCLKAQDLKP